MCALTKEEIAEICAVTGRALGAAWRLTGLWMAEKPLGGCAVARRVKWVEAEWGC